MLLFQNADYSSFLEPIMLFPITLLNRLAALSLLTLSSALSTTFSASEIYHFDTDGNAIDSTSGKIDFLGGSYLWYGLNFGCGQAFCGIQSWSSPDLVSLFDPAYLLYTDILSGQLEIEWSSLQP